MVSRPTLVQLFDGDGDDRFDAKLTFPNSNACSVNMSRSGVRDPPYTVTARIRLSVGEGFLDAVMVVEGKNWVGKMRGNEGEQSRERIRASMLLIRCYEEAR